MRLTCQWFRGKVNLRKCAQASSLKPQGLHQWPLVYCRRSSGSLPLPMNRTFCTDCKILQALIGWADSSASTPDTCWNSLPTCHLGDHRAPISILGLQLTHVYRLIQQPAGLFSCTAILQRPGCDRTYGGIHSLRRLLHSRCMCFWIIGSRIARLVRSVELCVDIRLCRGRRAGQLPHRGLPRVPGGVSSLKSATFQVSTPMVSSSFNLLRRLRLTRRNRGWFHFTMTASP